MEFSTAENLEGLTSASKSVKGVIQAITENWEEWKNLINSLSGLSPSGSSGEDRLLIAVIKILGRLCSEDCTILEEDEISGEGGDDEDEVPEQLLANVLRTVCNVEFFSVVTRKLASWAMIQPLKSGRSKTSQECRPRTGEMLTCLQNLCGLLMKLMPFTAKDACSNLILMVLGILQGSYMEQDQPQLLQGFQSIQETVVAMNKEFEKEDKEKKPAYGFSVEQELRMHEREPPSDFRTIPIVPTVKELMTDKHPFLRPNKAKGSYTDAEHYLDVQFRLLREDFVQPLRKGVEDFLEFREEYIRSNGRRRRRDVNQNSSVRIYLGVSFREMEIGPNGESCSYLFNLPDNLVRKVNWEKSKRLLPGSLVMLTSDSCHTASFATVLVPPFDWKKKNEEKRAGDPRRQELIRGILRVSVEAGSEFIQMNKPYVMLECEAFFEAYRYNLNILQKMNLAEFPLEKFLVSPDTSVASAPSYFFEGNEEAMNTGDENVPTDLKIKLPYFITVDVEQVEPEKQMSDPFARIRTRNSSRMDSTKREQCRVFIRDTESWPSLEIQQKMGLDENQYNACRAALTSELAIIQGPPGTGKTFIGLKIVQTILLNKRNAHPYLSGRSPPVDQDENGYYPKSPILVVCYTNHALDQFLELLLTHHEKSLNMVRVGGQCKSQILAGCSLAEKRRNLQQAYWDRDYNNMATQQQQRVRAALSELKEAERNLVSLQAEIEALSSFSAVINFRNLDSNVEEDLEKYVPIHILEMLMSGSGCLRFLGLPAEAEDDFRPFRDPRFSATNHLKGFFKLKTQIQRQPDLRHKIMSSQLQENLDQLVDNSYSSEDLHFDSEQMHIQEEEYDFDELVEQRVLDVYTEDYSHFDGEGSTDPIRKFRLPFFEDWSVDSLSGKLVGISLIIERFEVDLEKHCITEHNGNRFKKLKKKTCPECSQLKGRLDLQKQKKLRTENKLKFILALFNSYKSGLLDLPDISHLLKNNMEESAIGGDKSDNGLNGDSDDSDWEIAYDQPIQPNFMETNPVDIRWAIYFHVVKLTEKLSVKLIPKAKSDVDGARHNLTMERQMVDGLILQQADIVGMTTTGASKYHDLLEIAKPEIVIIEEAAEILEAHTVTALTRHCKHLILIGDHLQLRPSTNVFHLARKFHLDLSLFERMINNDMNLFSLKTQHRMRPEIADLIVGPIYEELHNNENVLHYPDVRGVGKNVFLISHNEPEESDNDILSKSNPHEADFLTTFCCYLIQQGYNSDQITILTTYTGQMFLLKKKLSRDCGRVRITCIDNYQGEENDIILLSLVRSNPENKIGFVGIENRICVALSRAKHGLFIMGNVESLTARSETWTQIYEKLNGKGNCGVKLPLKCQRHQNITFVDRAKDFIPLNRGGCNLDCDFKLNCGHLCVLKCHGLDQQHKEYDCRKKCEKLCQKQLHPCTAECFRDCPQCLAKVINKLNCGHHKEMYCCENPTNTVCREVVTRILPKCGHEEQLSCHMDYTSYLCRRRVKKVLECGHIKEMECHKDERRASCKELVEKQLPCGHNQLVYCFVKPADADCLTEVNFVFPRCKHVEKMSCCKTKKAKCVAQCWTPLKCEHKCRLDCHTTDDPNHEKYICKEKCKRDCGTPEHHPCQTNHRCAEKCPPCSVIVTKTLPCDPEHTAELACHDDGQTYKCQREIDRQLSCGHVARQKCSDMTDGSNCHELKLMKCGECNHERFVLCCLTSMLGCVNQECREKYHRRPKRDFSALQVLLNASRDHIRYCRVNGGNI